MVRDGQYLKKILELARFSPSSHNTQPWRVSITEDKVVVGYELQRHLTVGDPDKHELFLSLGCYIETIEQAAKAYGYQTVCEYIGGGPEGVARLSFTKKGSADTGLAGLIKRRRSDRRKFAGRDIPGTEINQLNNLTCNHAAISIFVDSKDISLLSEQTHKATLAAMSRGDFREELSGWIRNNWTNRPDGMPAYVQGIPGPVSLLAKTIIKKNPKVAPTQAKKDAKGVLNSSAVALVTIDRPSSDSWLDAGRLLQRLWLQTTKLGISAAAFSAAVVYAKTAKTIEKELGLKGQPVALLRLGYGKDLPKASPRRTLDQILA